MADNLSDNELNPANDSKDTQIINMEELNNHENENNSDISESIPDNSELADSGPHDTDSDNPIPPEQNAVAEENQNAENEDVPDVQQHAAEENKPAENVPVNSEPAELSENVNEEESKESSHKSKDREVQNSKFDAIYESLKTVKENGGTIDVNVIERIRGGLRVNYQGMPLFLPASHFGLKRNPSEQSMKDAIGKSFTVHIHEMQEDETKRKTVIVSRKQIMEDKFWNSLTVGDVIEGPITSIASFGIFIDVYGVEGLVHVTRLSNSRIEDLKLAFKKGQLMKAVIVEVNKERKRIGLSTKELEESPWKGLAKDILPGTVVKGIVRRITEFGVYFEVKPGVDGLLRNSEISWTLRIKHPNEIFNLNDEVDLYVISLNDEKKTLALSLKRVNENPWKSLSEKYPAQTKINGTIKYLAPQGAVININDEVDGFMPRSKMRFLPKGLNNPGDIIEVIIDSIDLEKESMIVVPPVEDKPQFVSKDRDKDKERRDNRPQPKHKESESTVNVNSDSASFTLQDLLSEKMKNNLLNN